MNRPEILAPTNSMESVIAAINAGCDAIYIGGKDFNARQYALNPSNDELKEIITLCHLRGVKVFITLNILYKDNEIQGVLDFINEVYSYGADGLIIQDIGIANLATSFYKGITISGSTQMTIHNIEGVKLLKELGFNRIVLARELSLQEVNDITQIKGDIEIESFIHGALCVSYSGRCLMSSIIGQRSGNRGRCAQPCRMEYTLVKNNTPLTKGYLLSPKDISTLPMLDKLLGASIDSLKIEGRMKSPEYIYQVTSTYKKYIDKLQNCDTLNIDNKDTKNITQIFNRGGSSSQGYYNTHSGKDMMSLSPKSSGHEIGKVISYNYKKKLALIKLTDSVIAGDGIEIWSTPHCGTNINAFSDKGATIEVKIIGNIKKGDRVFKSFDKALNDTLKKSYQKITRKQIINTSIICKVNESIKLIADDLGIIVCGDTSQVPNNQPMSSDNIISKLSKTGETPFELKFNNIEIDDIYLPISSLNNIRREFCAKLEEYIINSYCRDKINIDYTQIANNESHKSNSKPIITALVKTYDQLKACIDAKVDRVYCELLDEKYIDICHEHNIEIYFALPYIARNSKYTQYITKFDKTDCDGYLIRSYIELNTAKNIVTDYSLNILNKHSYSTINKIFNPSNITISPELNMNEIKAIIDNKSEVVIYGRLPLMTTHQCPIGIYEANKNSAKYCSLRNTDANYTLVDRKNANFPVLRDCDECIAYIYNSAPTYIINKYKNIASIGAGSLRLEFTIEDYSQAFKIIDEHIKVLKHNNEPSLNLTDTTNAHFGRGVL